MPRKTRRSAARDVEAVVQLGAASLWRALVMSLAARQARDQRQHGPLIVAPCQK